MRLITGCLRSTPVPWLPVLANIAPPGLRRQAATDEMVSTILRNSRWQLMDDFAICQPPASQAQISASHMVRGHNRRHRLFVERCLGVGLCGQPWPSA